MIFNYLDRDHDSALLYSDFVAMGQEAASGFVSLPTQIHTVDEGADVREQKAEMFKTTKIANETLGHNFSSGQLLSFPRTHKNIERGSVVPIHTNPDTSHLYGETSRKITDIHKPAMSADRLERIQTKTYGGASGVLNLAFDSFHNINGGRFESCLANEYQKDFVTDLRLKDTFRQDLKELRSQQNFRRDNIAQKLREYDSKRKLREQQMHLEKQYATSPLVHHKPGYVPSFYPSRLAPENVEAFVKTIEGKARSKQNPDDLHNNKEEL